MMEKHKKSQNQVAYSETKIKQIIEPNIMMIRSENRDNSLRWQEKVGIFHGRLFLFIYFKGSHL